jgi:hypothetical protein
VQLQGNVGRFGPYFVSEGFIKRATMGVSPAGQTYGTLPLHERPNHERVDMGYAEYRYQKWALLVKPHLDSNHSR